MKTQFYGIKYPFSEESEMLTFLDVNETKEESVRSMLLHIIFTPKGQRLRHPEFGTNLIKFIFEPNDDETWDSIKDEIRRQVAFYLPEVTFKNIEIIQDTEHEHDIYVQVDYMVEHNGVLIENNTLVKL